jgi:hypothetical protein
MLSKRKFFLGLAPFAVLVACAAMSTAAQAAPTWQLCSNTAPVKQFETHACSPGLPGTAFGWETIGATKLKVKTAGTLTLTASNGLVLKCNVTDTGNIWNEPGGKDEVLTFLNSCTSAQCVKVTATALGTPWPSELFEEAGVIRDRISGIKIDVVCETTEGTIEATFEGTLSPEMSQTNGTATFNTSAGSLKAGALTATVSGTDAIEHENGWAIRVHK